MNMSYRTLGEDLDTVRSLFEAFGENYEAFKTGKMRMEDEAKYKVLSSPGPSQYNAHARVFDLFKEDKYLVNKVADDWLCTYDFIDEGELTASPTLGFLERLCSGDYDVKGKDIVMTAGYFWKHNLKTREKVLSRLEQLQKKGANMRIYAQAKEDEPHIRDISEPIKSGSCFGIPNRISLHYIRVGDDLLLQEFPHTESTLFRLVLFLDLNKIGPEFKEGKTKKDLVSLLDNLIQEAV